MKFNTAAGYNVPRIWRTNFVGP